MACSSKAAASSGTAGNEWGIEPKRLFLREMIVIIDSYYIPKIISSACIRKVRRHGPIRLQKLTLMSH